jgi:hypothetical protein
VGDLSGRNFGLIIAYVLPGLLCLLGLAAVSHTVQSWLLSSESHEPVVAGFLYVTLASIGAGLLSSVIRWAVIDPIHHRTGLIRPHWDDSKLVDRLPAFNYIVENHYRYGQCYGNTLVVLPLAYALHRFSSGPPPVMGIWTDLAVITLCVILFFGSRNALGRYYQRAVTLLGQFESENVQMTNGNHHSETGGAKVRDGIKAKPITDPASDVPPPTAPKDAKGGVSPKAK